MKPDTTNRRVGLSASAVCLVAACIAFASPSVAQEEENTSPFRFLKPWIERQLFGRETTEPDPLPAPPSDPAALSPPPALPPEEAPAVGEAPAVETPQPAAAPATPVPVDDGAALLRGSAPSDGATPEAEATAPPADALAPAEAVPGTEVAKETGPQPLRFGVLAGRSLAATMAAVGPVADDLAALLGRPVEILPLTSYDAMIDAQAQRRIDGGFFSAAAYAVADARCACLEPLVAPRASDGTLGYHAVIVVRTGSSIASTADLAGKTVAIGAADSLGSRRVQLAGLLAEGVDPAAFGAAIEVESAEVAVSLVAAGAADAAFAWSSLSGNAASGYSRGTLAGLVAAGGASMDRLSIVWRSPLIGHAPFAVARTLAEEDKTAIEEYLVELAVANPSAYDTLDMFYGGGFAPVDPQSYGGLESLLAQNLDAIDLPVGPVSTGTTTAAPPGPAPEPVAPVAPQ